MSRIIDGLKRNQFNEVHIWKHKCPLCNADLYSVDSHMDVVCDGNMVVYCEEHEDHIFWQNARESSDTLHLNINSTSTNFHSDQDFALINGTWEIQ